MSSEEPQVAGRRRGRLRSSCSGPGVPGASSLTWWLALAVTFRTAPVLVAQDLSDACPHESYVNVSVDEEIQDGEVQNKTIMRDYTHRWVYRNYNVTTMNQPDEHRKLIINLEPCYGSVFLMVRKTRRCYPDPYSCLRPDPQDRASSTSDCKWTHFMTEIDGSYDGTATQFEIPLTTTKYYISVYAAEDSEYTLMVLADIGAFPRPGSLGQVTAELLTDQQIKLAWKPAYYSPVGVSETAHYWIYATMLMENDMRTNMKVLLRKDKILNTVCGLRRNTDRPYGLSDAGEAVPVSACTTDTSTGTFAESSSNITCKAVVKGVVMNKRYVFNIVAESQRGMKMAYAGLIMRTDWEVKRQVASSGDKTLAVVGAVSGSVLGMCVIIYFLLLKIYGG